MHRDENGTPVFVIGLTMAGAISAGAYTAGVLDYLFRAMKAHNDRVTRGPTADDPHPPRHKVLLKVMTGASAGGMCTGLAMGSLIQAGGADGEIWRTPKPVSYTDEDGNPAVSGYVLEPVYEAWVDLVNLWDADSGTGFLALDDLGAEAGSIDAAALGPMLYRPLPSVLNGLHLDDVARTALSRVSAWPDTGVTYDFLARDLDLLLTTTALNGTVYKITFAGSDDSFSMTQHAVTRHFRLNDLGQMPLASPWLEAWQDNGISLDLTSRIDGKVPFGDPDNSGNWLALTVAALATGAFPLGLMPRYVNASAAELGLIDGEAGAQGGALPIEVDPENMIVTRPDFAQQITAASATPYIAVDGGTTNNEPFELARFAIREKGPNGQLLNNPRSGDTAHRAVLMIDPFPGGASYTPLKTAAATQLASLQQSVAKLFPTLVAQARFKPAEIVQARANNIRSRFLISPSRTVRDTDGQERSLSGAAAMSSGALGGFGGFFDHGFRVHDFVLGQRNCQYFLIRHFTVAAHNPVLGLNLAAPQDAAQWSYLPVIDPGAGPLADEIRQPSWPTISAARLDAIMKQAEIRIEKAGRKLLDFRRLSWLKQQVLRWLWHGVVVVWPGGLRGQVTRATARTVLADFILRGQHATFTREPATDRGILVALLGAGDTPVTLEMLHVQIRAAARSGKLPVGAVVPSAEELKERLDAFVEEGWVKASGNLFGKPDHYAFVLGA